MIGSSQYRYNYSIKENITMYIIYIKAIPLSIWKKYFKMTVLKFYHTYKPLQIKQGICVNIYSSEKGAINFLIFTISSEFFFTFGKTMDVF